MNEIRPPLKIHISGNRGWIENADGYILLSFNRKDLEAYERLVHGVNREAAIQELIRDDSNDCCWARLKAALAKLEGSK